MGGLPMIALALVELAVSGVTDVAVVGSPRKPELADVLAELPPFPDPDWIRRLFRYETFAPDTGGSWPTVHVFEQREPRGVVHALHQAASFIGDEPFLLVMPDNLLIGAEPATLGLRTAHRDRPIIGLVTVTRAQASTLGNAGGVTVARRSGRRVRVSRLHDKTRDTFRIPPGEATALRAVGRSIVPASLAALPNPLPETGEIDDVPRLQQLAASDRLDGVLLDVEVLDLGQPHGLEAARRRLAG